jgi:hypothetical protein
MGKVGGALVIDAKFSLEPIRKLDLEKGDVNCYNKI